MKKFNRGLLAVITILILTFAVSCKQTYPEVSSQELVLTDTVTIAPKTQAKIVSGVKIPTKGSISVLVANYSDTDKIFIIDVRESGK